MSGEQNSNLTALVEETMRTLYDKGVAAKDLAPLIKLHDAIKAFDAAQNGDAVPATPPEPSNIPAEPVNRIEHEGRCGDVEASEDVLARVTAVIDILVQGGDNAEHATQIMARQLMASGVVVPTAGGDSRAWKRLFFWRNNLIHHKRNGRAWDIYCAFKEKLASIPPEDRLRQAVGERLWDDRIMRDQQTETQKTA